MNRVRLASVLFVLLLLSAGIPAGVATGGDAPAAVPADAGAPGARRPAGGISLSTDAAVVGQVVAVRGPAGETVIVDGPAPTVLTLSEAGSATFLPTAPGDYVAMLAATGARASLSVSGPSALPAADAVAPTALLLPNGDVFVHVRLPAADAPRAPPVVVTSLGQRIPLLASGSADGMTFASLLEPSQGLPVAVEGLSGQPGGAPLVVGSLAPGLPPAGVPALAASLLPQQAPEASGVLDALLAGLDLRSDRGSSVVGEDGERLGLPAGARVVSLGKRSMWVPEQSASPRLDASLYQLDEIERLQAAGLAEPGSLPVIVLAKEPSALVDLPVAPALNLELGLPALPAVSAPVGTDAVLALAEQLGALGLDVRPLPLVRGVATTVPMDALPLLAMMPRVESVHLDGLVEKRLDDSVPAALGQSRSGFATAYGVDGAGMRIAILDTGVNATHPALDDQDDNPTTHDPKVVAWSVLTGESCATPCDRHGHGTHVAGIAAGTAATSAYAGVAPGASILAGKVLDDWGYGLDSWVIGGIEWALDPDGNPATPDGAHVISMSLGGYDSSGGLDPMERAVEAATASGTLVVVAAGNAGSRPGTVGNPATAPSAFTVGASDHATGGIAYFSSRGPTLGGIAKPDISAPGVEITAPDTDGGYATHSGTSMATPHVAGAAALFLQARPGATVREAKGTLAAAADAVDAGPLDTGLGTLNLTRALESCLLVDEAIRTVRATGEASFVVRNRCATEVNLSAVLESTPGLAATLVAPASVASLGQATLVVNVTSSTEHAGLATVTFGAGSVALRVGAVVLRMPVLELDGPLASILGVLDEEGYPVAVYSYPVGNLTLPPMPADASWTAVALVLQDAIPGVVARPVSPGAVTRLDTSVLGDASRHVGFRPRAVPLLSACETPYIAFTGCSALRYDGPDATFGFTAIGMSSSSRLLVDTGTASWPDAPVADPLGPARTLRVDASGDLGQRVRIADALVLVPSLRYGFVQTLVIPEGGAEIDMSLAPASGPRATVEIESWGPHRERFGPYWATADGIRAHATGGRMRLYDDALVQLPSALFPFFGANVSGMMLSSNGFLSFGDFDSGCCEGRPIPDGASPNGIIAGYWTDLNPSAGGAIVYGSGQFFGSSAGVVQFRDVPLYGSADTASFEMGLLSNGQIVLSVLHAPASERNHTIGVEDRFGSEAVLVSHGNHSLSNVSWVLTPRYNASAPAAGTCATGSVHYTCAEVPFTWVDLASADVTVDPVVRLAAGPVLPYIQIQGGFLMPAAGPGIARGGEFSGPDGGASLDTYFTESSLEGAALNFSFANLPTRGGLSTDGMLSLTPVNGRTPAIVSLEGELFAPAPSRIRATVDTVGTAQLTVRYVLHGETLHEATVPLSAAPLQGEVVLPAFRGDRLVLDLVASDGSSERITLMRPDHGGAVLTLAPSPAGDCRPCLATLRSEAQYSRFFALETAGLSWGLQLVEGDTVDFGILAPGETVTRPVWLEMPAGTGPWLAVAVVQDEYGSGPLAIDTLAVDGALAAPTVTTGGGFATLGQPSDCGIIAAVSLDNATAGAMFISDCADLTLARPLVGRAVAQAALYGDEFFLLSPPTIVDVPEGDATGVTGLAVRAGDLDGDGTPGAILLDGLVTGPAAASATHACVTFAAHRSGTFGHSCDLVKDGAFTLGALGLVPDGELDVSGVLFNGTAPLARIALLDAPVANACCDDMPTHLASVAGIDVDGDGAPGWANVTVALDQPIPAGAWGLVYAERYENYTYLSDFTMEVRFHGRNMSATMLGPAVDRGTLWSVVVTNGIAFVLGPDRAPALGAEPPVHAGSLRLGSTPFGLSGWVAPSGEAAEVRGALHAWGPVGSATIPASAPGDRDASLSRPLTGREMDAILGERASGQVHYASRLVACGPAETDHRCVEASSDYGTAYAEEPVSLRARILGAGFADSDLDGVNDTLRMQAEIRSNGTTQGLWCALRGDTVLSCGEFSLRGDSGVVGGDYPLLAPLPVDGEELRLVAMTWGSGAAIASEPVRLVVDGPVQAAVAIEGVSLAPRDLDGDGVIDAAETTVTVRARAPLQAALVGSVRATSAPWNATEWTSHSDKLLSLPAGNSTHRLVTFSGGAASTPVTLEADALLYVSAGGMAWSGAELPRATTTALSTERFVATTARVEGRDGFGAPSATPSVGRVTITAAPVVDLVGAAYCPNFESTPRVGVLSGCDAAPLSIPADWWLDGGGNVSVGAYACYQGSCTYAYEHHVTTLPDAQALVETPGAWSVRALDLDGDADADAVQAGPSYRATGSILLAACIEAGSYRPYPDGMGCEPLHAANERGWGDVGPRLLLGSATGPTDIVGSVVVCATPDCSARTFVDVPPVTLDLGGSRDAVDVQLLSVAQRDLDGDGVADAAIAELSARLTAGYSSAAVSDGSRLRMLTPEAPEALVTRVVLDEGGFLEAVVCHRGYDDHRWYVFFGCAVRPVNATLEPFPSGNFTATPLDANSDGVADGVELSLPGALPSTLRLASLEAWTFYGDAHYDFASRPIAAGENLTVRLPFTHASGPTRVQGALDLYACLVDAPGACFVASSYATTPIVAGIAPAVTLDVRVAQEDVDADGYFDRVRSEAAWSSLVGGEPRVVCFEVCFDGEEVLGATGVEAIEKLATYDVSYPWQLYRHAYLEWSAPGNTTLHLQKGASTIVVPSLWEASEPTRVLGTRFHDSDGSGVDDTLLLDLALPPEAFATATLESLVAVECARSASSLHGGDAAGRGTLRLALDPLADCEGPVAARLFSYGPAGSVRLLPHNLTKPGRTASGTSFVPVDAPAAGFERALDVTASTVNATSGWINASATYRARGFDLAYLAAERYLPDHGLEVFNESGEANGTLDIEGPALRGADVRMTAYAFRNGSLGSSRVSYLLAPGAVAAGPDRLAPHVSYADGNVTVGLGIPSPVPIGVVASTGCAELHRGKAWAKGCEAAAPDAGSGVAIGSAIPGAEARPLVGDRNSTLLASVHGSAELDVPRGFGWAGAWGSTFPVTVDGARLALPAWADAAEPDSLSAPAPLNGTLARGFHGYDDTDWFRAAAAGTFVACPDAPSLGLVLLQGSTETLGAGCVSHPVAAGDLVGVQAADAWRYGPEATYRATLVLEGSAPDLRIVPGSILVSGSPATGRLTHVSVVVQNRGEGAADNATLRLLADGVPVATLLTGPIAPGANATRTLDWTPANGGDVELVVEATAITPPEAPGNGTDNRASARVFVAARAVVLTPEGPTAAIVPPGGEVTYRALVRNAGNVGDTFAFTASPAPAGWAYALSAWNATLAPNATALVNVTVRAPENATGATAHLALHVNSTAQPERSASLGFATTVRAEGVLVEVTNTTVRPGGNGTAHVRIANVTQFGTATIDITYNASVARVVAVQNGNVSGSSITYNVNNSIGRVRILVTTSDVPGPSGDLLLADIVFQAVGPNGAATPLRLNVTELAHADGSPVEHFARDGLLQVRGLLGDVNGDGRVTGVDALFISQYVVGNRQATDLILDNADVNRDGRVSGVDALFISQHVVGNRPEL